MDDKYAVASDEELAERREGLERDIQRAQWQQHRLEQLEEHYLQHQEGPRTTEVLQQAQRWREDLDALDGAEAAGVIEDAAVAR